MSILNVIIVCDYANTNGGSEKVAIESALGLARLDINVIFFSAVGPVDKRLLEEKNIKVICLGQKDIKSNKFKINGFTQGIWNNKSKKAFDKILKQYPTESTIIHAHLWQKALSSSIFYNAIKKKYRIVFTMHHYFLSCPNGGFYDYQKNEICKCTALSKECLSKNCDSRNYIYKAFRLVRMFVEKKIIRLQSNIKEYIYISELGYKVSRESLPQDSNYYYLNNPFNIEKEDCVDVTKNQNYIFIGRLSAEKGVIQLAKISKQLNLPVVIVGDGPEKNKMLDINPNLIFKGWVSPEEVKKYIRESRALIFPTLWYEGMPMSILECFAQGIPAIIPDTCAATQIVKNMKTGFVYKQNDLESLIQCINNAENNKYLNKASEEAYNYFWKSNYSIDSHCQSLISIYHKVLNK